MSLLQIYNLFSGYGTKEVLKGIDFNVKIPRFIGIIGANGCGKTTLLKNISGYYKPWSGNVKIAEKDVSRMTVRERARTIGYVPQDISSDFAFVCYDLVMMGRIPYLKRFQRENCLDREIVQDSMELTYTWHFKDRIATELSGGERQRVYIARSLAQKPKMLLLDEPVSHLDIKYQVEILTLLKELVERGILVLAVLHDINLASQFCDEIIMMKDGLVLSRGSASEVLTAQNIDQAFSINVEIFDNPHTHTPYLVPLTKKKTKLKVV